MTRPTVVVLCEHGEAKPHRAFEQPDPDEFFYVDCPGGRVLEQAIIIERDTDGEWPKWALKAAGYHYTSQFTLDALASAQESQA